MTFSTAHMTGRIAFRENRLLQIFLVLFLILWGYTLLGTTDPINWMIENTLTGIFILLLTLSYRRFTFSDLAYTFMFVYICLHVYGAMYTYAENPFGYWLKDFFGFERNHYDRIVHFSFGFMLAYPIRDFFLNKMEFPNWVGWLLPIEITLSFSCLYELIEWAVADVFFPAQGTAYLGTQGDTWDAQKDMFMAFSGAVLIILLVMGVKRAMGPSKK